MARSDRQLIAAAKSGSQDAYRDLVERYQRPVFALVVRIVRDRALAEDVAQEAFIKAFQALGTFEIQRKFSSWLFKIAHNSAIDALRRKRVATVPLESPHEEGPDLLDSLPGPESDSPEAVLAGRDVARALSQALGELRPDYRSAVELRFIQGLTYEEISEIMQIPLGTVKTHLHRARKALAAALRARGFEPPAR
jgi:RNA polymerase sigma-70 factor (ECF subfamily)